jgi:outer membrane lipoprotein
MMRTTYFLQTLIFLTTLLLGACAHPVSQEVREQVDEKTTFAMVSENPTAFLNQHLIVGGVVITAESADAGSVLEVMEWHLSRWGEPLYLDETGRRFLVKTSKELDPTIYEPGTLVTLAGVVLGLETRLSGEHKYAFPVFDMTDYGIHSNINPAYPYYVGQDDDPRRHPYDPGYNPYPYTQYWYRNSGSYKALSP